MAIDAQREEQCLISFKCLCRFFVSCNRYELVVLEFPMSCNDGKHMYCVLHLIALEFSMLYVVVG